MADQQAKTMDDDRALDLIAETLREPTWPSGADFLEWVAGLVRATGRVID